MTDPTIFPTTTARHGLPLLFAAQAQKEFFVNEAHVLSDMLHHTTVEGVADMPPAAPNEGDCWIVGTGGTEDFAGRDDAVAGWQQGQWTFVAPVDGMSVFDRSIARRRYYRGGWHCADTVTVPAQGPVIDAEARETIAALADALRIAGIIG